MQKCHLQQLGCPGAPGFGRREAQPLSGQTPRQHPELGAQPLSAEHPQKGLLVGADIITASNRVTPCLASNSHQHAEHWEHVITCLQLRGALMIL